MTQNILYPSKYMYLTCTYSARLALLIVSRVRRDVAHTVKTSDVFRAFSTIRRLMILCTLLILQHVIYENKESCMPITAVCIVKNK